MDQQNNQVKYCSYCGSQNNKENKFCTSCGGNLEEIVQEQTISQDTPVNNNQPILQPKQSPKEEKEGYYTTLDSDNPVYYEIIKNGEDYYI
jgi:hypothetical protein